MSTTRYLGTITQHTNLTQDQWHALRAKVITSTEVSALFGLSPYETEFELWHRKKAGVIVTIEPNERMTWGTRLQNSIAKGIAEDNKWNLASADGEFRECAATRIGASFDFFVRPDGSAEWSILEIKNVDSLAFKQGWVVGADGEIEAPAHIELQVQHQMMLTGLHNCWIGCLVGGNTVKLLSRAAAREVQEAIAKKVAAFWRSIKANDPPTPDLLKDAELLRQQNLDSTPGETLQVPQGAPEFGLILELVASQAEEKKWGEEVTRLKSALLLRIGTASKVVSEIATVSCGTTAESPGTLITPEMVGTYYGARKAFRQLRVTPKKEKS